MKDAVRHTAMHSDDLFMLAYLTAMPTPVQMQEVAKTRKGVVAAVVRLYPMRPAAKILRMLEPWMTAVELYSTWIPMPEIQCPTCQSVLSVYTHRDAHDRVAVRQSRSSAALTEIPDRRCPSCFGSLAEVLSGLGITDS